MFDIFFITELESRNQMISMLKLWFLSVMFKLQKNKLHKMKIIPDKLVRDWYLPQSAALKIKLLERH